MHIVLFVLYLAVLCYVLSRIKFLSAGPIPSKFVIMIFLLYVSAGAAHVWIAYHYFPNHGDVWQFYFQGVQMKNYLVNDPGTFLKEIVPDSFAGSPASTTSGWSQLQHQVLIIIHVLLNIFSFDNIYINTMLFCFLMMWGKMAFFRVLDNRFPAQRFVNTALAFLLPSVVFWTAVIHKEGLLYSFIGLLLYALSQIANSSKPAFKHVMLAILSIVMTFLLRNIVLVILLPAVMIWMLSLRGWTTLRAFVAVGAAVIAGLGLLALLDPGWNLWYQISQRQQEFSALEGGSRIPLPNLDGSAASFLRCLPYAALNGFLMPLPGVGGKTIYTLFGFELLFYWTVVAYGTYYAMLHKSIRLNGLAFSSLLFAVTALLVTGYIVPFVGALVRYKSIFYPFLLLPFVSLVRHLPLLSGKSAAGPKHINNIANPIVLLSISLIF